jgi:seryl-tRNA synthetase
MHLSLKMLDIKKIRHAPQELDQVLLRRNPGAEKIAEHIVILDEQHRHLETELQRLRQSKNALSQWNPKDSDQEKQGRILQAAVIKQQEEEAVLSCKMAKETFEAAIMVLPNWIASDVPNGNSENDNVQVHAWGQPGTPPVGFKDHATWGREQGLLDTDQAGKIAGARFNYLLGDLARLERALGQWMLDVQTQHFGFTEMAVPYLVRQNAVFGAGQWPKFKDDLFTIHEQEHDRFLIPTAEVPLVNWAADQIFDMNQLPLCLTALTPCFRSEAGSAGKDTTGLLRLHQFNKVELVVVCLPESSEMWHEKIRQQAEFILESLGLAYRTVVLCAGDMGAGAEKTYDIEVWVPSQNRYREIASCSRCGDYQSRRMQARYRKSDGKIDYLHTLNGSGLPTGRTLLALIENFQRPDGTIDIPAVLQPYMGGKTTLGKPNLAHPTMESLRC